MEKSYEEALERARKGMSIDKIFPELNESDDERIRKNCIHFLELQSAHHADTSEIDECIAYLEKQKDILGEIAKNITANMLEDGIEGIQRELIEFLSNTVNASWVDIIQSADAYAERIRNIIEKQKEQKPAEWSEEEKMHLYNAIEAVKYVYDVSEGTGGFKCVEFLKSLRPRPHWKPSEEQMGALKYAAYKYTNDLEIRWKLESLFDDLQELKND